MLRLEGFMEIQKLHHDGVSVSEIARQLNLDRKTVRKYLRQAPREYERKPKKWKVDPFRAYLRERWECGVMNASRLFVDIQKRGYAGGVTQVRASLGTVAERGPGAGVCPLRDRAGRAGADGLGAFRQLGWTASLWLCPHAVLVADAV